MVVWIVPLTLLLSRVHVEVIFLAKYFCLQHIWNKQLAKIVCVKLTLTLLLSYLHIA